MQSARDKALLCNTLIGIVKACEGKRIQIDLRNELHVFGKVESVHSDMNVVMSDAYLTMPSCSKEKDEFKENTNRNHYDEITIRGCNIRFVHIPDEIDMLEALSNQIMIVKHGAKTSTKNGRNRENSRK